MRAAAVTLLALAALVTRAAAAPPDLIRTGGPSAPGEAKLAIVASAASRVGDRFTVVDARGRTVLRGRLRAVAGDPAPWRRAAVADLSAIRAAGSYRVRTGRLTSRAWVVRAGGRNALLRRLLRLFAVNRDGREPNPVFGPAHLNDAVVADGPHTGRRFDLTGGWRDAGDNLKFVQTTAMAVVYLEVAARLAPEAAAALRREADVGVRWLRKAHPAAGLFLVQVGDGRDHETDFRDPAGDDASGLPGIAQRLAYPSAGSNTAGIAAAALALAAERSAGTGRAELLDAAREWYAAGRATAAPTDVEGEFYEPQDWADDMALAGAVLGRATGDGAFLAQAREHLAAAPLESGLDSFTITPLAAAELCGALGASAAADPAAREAGCAGLRTAARAAAARAAATAFGTPGPFAFGAIQDIAGSGAIAAAAARRGLMRSGSRIAAGARDYITGRNPWGATFLVGRGTGEARNPHHPAFLKGSPARLLSGAVVGGPAKPSDLTGLGTPGGPYARFNSPLAVYEDRRDNYVTSEVGIAYSASAVLLAASLGR